jgi:hypothetical protein
LRVEAPRKCVFGRQSSPPCCWPHARRHEPQRVRARSHLASSQRRSRSTTSPCHRPRTIGSRGCASIGTCGLHAKASCFATSRIGSVCITDERPGAIHERVTRASLRVVRNGASLTFRSRSRIFAVPAMRGEESQNPANRPFSNVNSQNIGDSRFPRDTSERTATRHKPGGPLVGHDACTIHGPVAARVRVLS